VVRNVARRIAECRVALGWTQLELAERMGVSIQYEQRVESGRANLTLNSLARWSAMLRVHPRELFNAPTTPPPGRGRPPGRPARRPRR
jgi:transcriptional regulator with XRE-family HTH domain